MCRQNKVVLALIVHSKILTNNLDKNETQHEVGACVCLFDFSSRRLDCVWVRVCFEAVYT